MSAEETRLSNGDPLRFADVDECDFVTIIDSRFQDFASDTIV